MSEPVWLKPLVVKFGPPQDMIEICAPNGAVLARCMVPAGSVVGSIQMTRSVQPAEGATIEIRGSQPSTRPADTPPPGVER